MTQPAPSPIGWPLRSWGLAIAGAGTGVAVHFLLPRPLGSGPALANRESIATFLIIAGLAFAYVVERQRPVWSLVFALLAGVVVAGVVRNGGGSAGWDDGETWRLVCAGLTIAIAAPLFQAWRDAQDPPPAPIAARLPYVAAHDRAWTNIVLWFASFTFVGIVWLLAFLLSALFSLIGIDTLEHLLRERGVAFALSGAALGAGIGLLRDRDAILGTLQRVVMTVLSVLAPILGLGLVLFLAALPFTGLQPLWSATKSTTPILLSCIIAALVLVNAVIGDSPADTAKSRLLRWGAIALAAAMPVLGVIAAVSVGVRIRQYGLTPDRIWAVTFTTFACAYGLAYVFALVRGRGDWAAVIRIGNLRLGFALCATALLLATPLIDFGAISTRNQLARLAGGTVDADHFDWRALRFDFGPTGRTALARLAKAGTTADIRKYAAQALKADDRWELGNVVQRSKDGSTLAARLFTIPANTPIPADLREHIAEMGSCGGDFPCVVEIDANGAAATITADLSSRYGVSRTRLIRRNGAWAFDSAVETAAETAVQRRDRRDRSIAALRAGRAEIREVPRKQLFIDGKPVGEPY